MMATPAVMNTE